MARLKQHIERVHTKPIQCDRCWKDMPSKEALKQHIKMDPICDNVDRPTDDDRVCKQWLKNLNLNQLPFSQATCPSKKWNMLYDKIFPGEGDMPECYEEPGMTAAEKRRFLQLLAEKLATECGTEISQRFPILVQECKQEMHGMGKHMPQDKAEGIGKTQLLSLPPNPLSPPWTTVAPDRTHELCIWETPAPVAQQPYQAHLDPDIEAEVKKPSTPYLPWTDWPDASPGIEYGIDDLVQHSKNAEPAKSKDEGDDHVPISGFRESSGELPELHASNDDDAIFEAFVQYPPDQYPPDQGPLEEPRDGG
ncbi:hypothetical protein BDV96DRAFT_599951 [Lophiotrema nucula]|uniref:C2H2-type domain-containing protein n=1 Tax=Lophiotrema nucula TaxID=690887 RepID=A0A6A5Z5P6_9PLEO|nr:hypothetical protein BDV96DRAFT_599951 [Lophiotrema nucula]